MKTNLDTQKKDKGFTLVELLIVIVILGILATVTVFAVRGITDQGKKSTCDSDKKTLEVAVEAYYAKWNVDPTEAQLVSGGFIKSALAELRRERLERGCPERQHQRLQLTPQQQRSTTDAGPSGPAFAVFRWVSGPSIRRKRGRCCWRRRPRLGPRTIVVFRAE